MRISRFKKLASRVVILSVVACMLLPVLGNRPFAFAQDQPTGKYQTKSTYLSPVKESPIPFTGLAMKWHQEIPKETSVDVAIKFKTSGGWTDWLYLEGEFDDPEGQDENNPEDFVSTSLATAYQYKVEMSSENPDITPVIENLEFTYVHAKPATASAELDKVESSFSSTSYDTSSSYSGGDIRIISRGGWSANEQLRIYEDGRPEGDVVPTDEGFEKQFSSELQITKTVSTNPQNEDLTWPLEYPEKVSKFIIHHTATTKNMDDPKQAIRDIYYYHSITRGWGDIGYNYIIDQDGNIYEGRYGGDGVVGGHAARYNVGSVGIAVLGNYQENEVPQPVIDALVALIQSKAAKHGIDPMGKTMFRGELSYNVLGHRDVGSTACPGQNLYDLLPTIRKLANGAMIATIIDKRRIIGDVSQYDYDLEDQMELVQIDAESGKVIDIEVENTGTDSWNNETYFMVSNNGAQEYLTNGNMLKTSRVGTTVKPGETAQFKLQLLAGHQGGFTNLEVFPMINGSKKLEKYISIPLQIVGASYDYDLVSLDLNRKYLRRGQIAQAVVKLKNTGTTTWKNSGANKIMLGADNPRDHVSRVIANPDTRLAGMTEAEVKPGETGEFIINIRAPNREGYFREYFTPVIEGVTWLPDKGTYIEFFVSDSSYSAKYIGSKITGTFLPGEKKQTWIELTNIGRVTWFKESNSPFTLDIVKSANLDVSDVELQADSVLPGETVKVNMLIQAPLEEGMYRALITPRIGDHKLTIRPIVLFINVSKSGISETNWISQEQTVAQSNFTSTPSNNIRIGLSFRGNPVISADGTFKLFEGNTELGTFNPNEKVNVSYDQSKFQVRGDRTGYVLSGPPVFKPVDGAIMRIDNYENRPDWNQNYNDNEYQGNLEVHYYENELQVVNELPLEAYLKGLAEIDANENYEKIKAIIVLARSYAKYYMTIGEKFPGAPYQLSDDAARSQKYLGYGFTRRNITGGKAVEDTKDQVVTYNGQLIKTPYFSSSDGRTRSAEEVWGWTDTPYLVSVDDPGCAGNTLRGHGVGLSGCGAQYFAQQGKNYMEIIKYYFKGVEITPKTP